MKSFSSLKAAWNLLGIGTLLGSANFHWEEFIYPSTLQLSSLLDILLEPVQSKNAISRLQLGLQEALVNAVQHGNAGDPNRNLRIRRICTPNWFIWQIQDEGKGAPEHARVGRLPLHLDSNTGRGLFLIYQCFDDVRWSRKGNRLQLACRRSNLLSGADSLDPLFPS